MPLVRYRFSFLFGVPVRHVRHSLTRSQRSIVISILSRSIYYLQKLGAFRRTRLSRQPARVIWAENLPVRVPPLPPFPCHYFFLRPSFSLPGTGLRFAVGLCWCVLMSTPVGSPCPTPVLFNHAALPGCRQACC